MKKYKASEMTLVGYDRDNDKVWTASDGNTFVTGRNGTASDAAGQGSRLPGHMSLKDYAYGPITKRPK